LNIYASSTQFFPWFDEDADLQQPGGLVVGASRERVPSLLGHPLAGRAGGDAGEVDLAAGKLDEEQDVEAPEPGRLDREKSVASIWAACWRTNRRQVVRLRRGADGMPRLRRILATPMWEIRKPSLSASP
jgi:hypothetical protein